MRNVHDLVLKFGIVTGLLLLWVKLQISKIVTCISANIIDCSSLISISKKPAMILQNVCFSLRFIWCSIIFVSRCSSNSSICHNSPLIFHCFCSNTLFSVCLILQTDVDIYYRPLKSKQTFASSCIRVTIHSILNGADILEKDLEFECWLQIQKSSKFTYFNTIIWTVGKRRRYCFKQT